VRTLEDLVRVCEIDLNVWEVERWVANKWEVAAKGTDQQLHHAPLFQIKVWLKKRLVHLATQDEIASLIASTKTAITTLRPISRAPKTGLALELSVPDLHMGKLAWAKETGSVNYDVKIAEKVFANAIDALLDRTAHHTFEQIIFPVGNDLLNADSVIGTTTNGTPQDNDARFQKTFSAARQLITSTIERLRQLAPVLVIMVPGNHDQLSVWHLGDSLECYFHKHDNVTIENTPTFRKYHQFGQVMLMFTHGDTGQKADYPLLMATERPMMWGTSTYREAHVGHIHRMKVEEYHGVKVRVSPALCAIDAWHTWKQFTGNNRSAEAFVWHRQEGMIGQAFYTVQE
jgi:hypothetical protein